MNVSQTSQDAVRGIVKIEVVKADYADTVEKNLRDLRKNANLPGFRKGQAPMGILKKMYGKHIMAEEVNKLVSENLMKFISENNFNVLGEPLPNETEQKEINFDTDEDFEFVFDLALAPEINMSLTKRDKLPFYKVIADDKMVNEQIDAYRANFGGYEEVDGVEEKDLVKGLATELENGEPKEGGIVVENAVLMPMYIKDEVEKAKFLNATLNSVVVFNPAKAYEGAELEIAAFLKIDKAKAADTLSDFNFEIREVTRHKPAELNQEFFDKVFGEGAVKDEEEFTAKVRETIEEQFTPQADFKFMTDARGLLLKKAGKLEFAEDILKRWLLLANEDNTPETIEEDYPRIVEDLTFHLAKESIVKKNGLKVEEADIMDLAKKVAKSQFVQYGMMSVPENAIENYAKELLKNKETMQNIIDRSVENKLATWLKSHIKQDVKEVSMEEFNKLFQ